MKAVVTDKWILCPVCGAKTRTQILDDTELKHFPLFCPKCKEISTLESNGNSISCNACGFKADYMEDLSFDMTDDLKTSWNDYGRIPNAHPNCRCYFDEVVK